MKLGLGIEIPGMQYFGKSFLPSDLEDLKRWYRHDTLLLGESGENSPNMPNDTKIEEWGDSSGSTPPIGVSYNLYQSSSGNKPKWKSTNYGPHWLDSKYMFHEAASAPVMDDDFTFHAVIKTQGATLSGGDGLFGGPTGNTDSFFYIRDNTQMVFKGGSSSAINGGSIIGATLSLNTTFHSLCLVRDADHVNVYLDGHLWGTPGTQIVTPAHAAGDVDFNSWGSYAGDTFNFNGLIRDMALYNRALEPSEIEALSEYAATLPPII